MIQTPQIGKKKDVPYLKKLLSKREGRVTRRWVALHSYKISLAYGWYVICIPTTCHALSAYSTK